MSKPIAPGDQVMVVRPLKCCGHESRMYQVFTVQKLGFMRHGICNHCDGFVESEPGAQVEDMSGFFLYQLKRLDPLEEPEEILRIEEVPA